MGLTFRSRCFQRVSNPYRLFYIQCFNRGYPKAFYQRGWNLLKLKIKKYRNRSYEGPSAHHERFCDIFQNQIEKVSFWKNEVNSKIWLGNCAMGEGEAFIVLEDWTNSEVNNPADRVKKDAELWR